MKLLRKTLNHNSTSIRNKSLISLTCFNRPKPEIEDCFVYADIVFFNKEYVNVSINIKINKSRRSINYLVRNLVLKMLEVF